jgi:hypothetical protein
MTTRDLVRALSIVRRGGSASSHQHRTGAAARMDFSVLPVCGSVRPLASQRAQVRAEPSPIRTASPSALRGA